jgi:hypothetical protein
MVEQQRGRQVVPHHAADEVAQLDAAQRVEPQLGERPVGIDARAEAEDRRGVRFQSLDQRL